MAATTETETKNDRTWDDLNTDLNLNEDATEEWGPDYPKEDE